MAGLWYRSGSVSVAQASKQVTGLGTLWKTALNRPDKGNVFYGPDGKAYEIDFVTTETELYLVEAYAGANASAQSYKIDVRGGTVPELSRQLSTHYAYMQGVIDSLQAIVSGSGDVTITGPDGHVVTIPSLSNMLSKSGNLSGINQPDVALGHLGLSAFAIEIIKLADAEGLISKLGLSDKYLPNTGLAHITNGALAVSHPSGGTIEIQKPNFNSTALIQRDGFLEIRTQEGAATPESNIILRGDFSVSNHAGPKIAFDYPDHQDYEIQHKGDHLNFSTNGDGGFFNFGRQVNSNSFFASLPTGGRVVVAKPGQYSTQWIQRDGHSEISRDDGGFHDLLIRGNLVVSNAGTKISLDNPGKNPCAIWHDGALNFGTNNETEPSFWFHGGPISTKPSGGDYTFAHPGFDSIRFVNVGNNYLVLDGTGNSAANLNLRGGHLAVNQNKEGTGRTVDFHFENEWYRATCSNTPAGQPSYFSFDGFSNVQSDYYVLRQGNSDTSDSRGAARKDYVDAKTSSDARLKTNYGLFADPLGMVLKLDGKTFDKKDPFGPTVSRRAGVVAQEVEAVLPEAIGWAGDEETGIKTVDPLALCGLLIESIKELKSKVDAIELSISGSDAGGQSKDDVQPSVSA